MTRQVFDGIFAESLLNYKEETQVNSDKKIINYLSHLVSSQLNHLHYKTNKGQSLKDGI